jgi:similar to stage IV sporulation protein
LILKKLAGYGIKPGTVKYGIDTKKLAGSLMLDIKELSWVGVTVKGTKVKIQVDERFLPPPMVPKTEPCNIVARRDGIIKSIVSKAGFDVAKAGDTVAKGQLLVTGVVPGRDEKAQTTLVHAVSTVEGEDLVPG